MYLTLLMIDIYFIPEGFEHELNWYAIDAFFILFRMTQQLKFDLIRTSIIVLHIESEFLEA